MLNFASGSNVLIMSVIIWSIIYFVLFPKLTHLAGTGFVLFSAEDFHNTGQSQQAGITQELDGKKTKNFSRLFFLEIRSSSNRASL